MNVDACLEDLEAQINPEIEEDLLQQWKSFCCGQCRDEFFVPRRKGASFRKLKWPKYCVNETLEDFDKMLIQQLSGCAGALEKGSGSMLGVRSNYGVVILAMPFGAELFKMQDEQDTLPNCHPMGLEKIRQIADRPLPSVDDPYLQKVWEMGRRFMEVKRKYPRIGKYVFVYHPDFQGPMDVLELLWGSDIFYAFGDEPGFMHRMLRLMTDFYKATMKRWQEVVPNWDPHLSCHWSHMQRGQIMIRDDSAMNLPPAVFEEFIRPYDQELLDTFGGGAIHACGRVDHYSRFFRDMPGMYGFNMSQPHLNNMETVFSDTVDQGIQILDLAPGATQSAAAAGRKLHGRVVTRI